MPGTQAIGAEEGAHPAAPAATPAAATPAASRPARPDAVSLTPAALSRIAELMARAPDDAIGVRLATPRRGCSGLAYSVDYVCREDRFDEKIITPGGVLYIDGASVLYLVGSVMDWREDDFSAGFVFENPNAKGACGCGESFMV